MMRGETGGDPSPLSDAALVTVFDTSSSVKTSSGNAKETGGDGDGPLASDGTAVCRNSPLSCGQAVNDMNSDHINCVSSGNAVCDTETTGDFLHASFANTVADFNRYDSVTSAFCQCMDGSGDNVSNVDSFSVCYTG